MSTPTKRKLSDPSPPDKKSGAALSPQAIDYLRNWMMSLEHMNHPYPTDEEKTQIMEDTGISSKQLTCWFSNNRKRYWKPKMEEMGRGGVVEAAMGNTLSPHIVDYLKAWMMSPDHISNPYPTEEEKAQIMAATGIEKKQLTCWFSNNRKRYWKPKMDKLRAQYGLSESDPLPAVLLANLSPEPKTDNLREQYGLIESDPLPATLLDTLAPDPGLSSDNINHFDVVNQTATDHAVVGNYHDIVNYPGIVNHPDVPNHATTVNHADTTSYDMFAASAPAVEPVAALPLEDFTENFYGGGIDTAGKVHSHVQQDEKRQKVASDDVVAV